MIYRALRSLETGKGVINRGELVLPGMMGEKTAQALCELGRIAPASLPPLGVLPGWKTRARKFAKAGIADTEQFLEAPDAELAQAAGAPAERIAAWKKEIIALLTVPRPSG